jgi:hypothetical protein
MDLTLLLTGILTGVEDSQFYAANIDFSELPFVDLADSDFIKNLPSDSAIYFILNKEGKPVYVGKAIRLQERWRNHHCFNRAKEEGLKLAWIRIVSAFLMTLESLFILTHRPEWNQNEFFEDEDYLFPGHPRRLKGILNKGPKNIWDDVSPVDHYVPVHLWAFPDRK